MKFPKNLEIEILLKLYTFNELHFIYGLKEDIRVHITLMNTREIARILCSFAWQAQMLLLEEHSRYNSESCYCSSETVQQTLTAFGF